MKTIKYRDSDFLNIRSSSPMVRINTILLIDPFRSKSCNKMYLKQQNLEKHLEEIEITLIKSCCEKVPIINYRKEQQQANVYQKFIKNVEKAIKQEENSEQSKSYSKSKKSNQSSKDSTIPEDLKKVYDGICYQKFIDKEQLNEDVLQLEALYYQLASLGLHISPMLSLPPIISYFTYSLFINNLDDSINLSKKDKQLSDFINGFQNSTSDKLIQQGLVQSPQYQENISKWKNSLELIFLTIKPENLDFSQIDQNIVLEDYKIYRDLSINQKDKIIESLDEKKFIWRKNNILITFLRFVFKNINNNESFNIRVPVSEFATIQFTDMIDVIMKCENLEIENLLDYTLFLSSQLSSHSEKAMLSFLIYDSLKDQQIFKLLEQKLGNIDQNQLILEIILMEVTTENRTCSNCVHTYNQFPIKRYCQLLLRKFDFQIMPKFFLIVLSQYLNEPQFNIKSGKKIENKIRIFQVEQSKQGSQKSKQSSGKLSQDEPSNLTEYYIIQEELGATGLLSAQFFQNRYCKQNDKTHCKTSIQEVQLNFKEAIEIHKQTEANQELQEKLLQQQQNMDFQNSVQQRDSEASFQQKQETQVEENQFQEQIIQEKPQTQGSQQVDQQQEYKIKQQTLSEENAAQLKVEEEGQNFQSQFKQSNQQQPEVLEQQQQLSDQQMKQKQSEAQPFHQQEQMHSEKDQDLLPIQQEQQQQSVTQQQYKKKNRLFDLLNFTYNPIIQLQQNIPVIRQKEDLQKVVDDFMTRFLVSMMVHYCKASHQKNFQQFQIQKLRKVLKQIVIVNFNDDSKTEFNIITMSNITPVGMIFNQSYDQTLLLTDYKFLENLFAQSFPITPLGHLNLISKQQQNAIHNEFEVQLFQYDKEQQQWQALKLEIDKIQIIMNCKELFKLIQLLLQNVNQYPKQRYFLLISMLYEIDERCKRCLENLIYKDLIIKQLDLTIQFSSLNLMIEKQKKGNEPFQIAQKTEINIKFENTNLLNYQNFMNRYQRQQNIEKVSFIDTEQISQEFCCYDCTEHDEIIKQQVDRAYQTNQ